MVKKDFNSNWLFLKQSLKWIPAQLGLVKMGAFKLQLKEIREDDLFLISYPKSGNTWLRYILAAALKGRIDFSFKELEIIIPDVYLSKNKINSTKAKRIIKSHDPIFDYLPSTIYIYRDIRDVMVSYYHYSVNAKEYSGTLKEFIRSDFPTKHFGSWQNHVSKAIEAKKKGKRILLISYEDMLQNPELNIAKIINFSGIVPTITASEIAALSSFKNLQKNEREKGSYFGTRALFFRKGESRKGETGLDESDIEFLLSNPDVKSLMKELGYIK